MKLVAFAVRRVGYGLLLYFVVTCFGCCPQVLENDRVRVEVNLGTGRFDVYFEGRLTLKQAAVALLRGQERQVLVAADDGLQRSAHRQSTPEGKQVLTITHPGTGTPERGLLRQQFTLQDSGGGLEIDLTYKPCPLDTEFMALTPAFVGAEGSALFVGEAPATHRILQDGSDLFMDMHPRIMPGDQHFDEARVLGDLSPFSNWNSLIYDLATDWQLVSGGLSFERMAPFVYTAFDPDLPEMREGERLGFTTYAAGSMFVCPHDVSGWEEVRAETSYMDVTRGSPHEALEDYAARIAERQHIVLPDTVPSGWDSWSCYGQQITQQNIMDNLSALTNRFGPYGLTSMEIDMGWYGKWGDWGADPARFPEGIDHIAAAISAAGLRPEIWIAPFSASEDSDLVSNHPDWIAEPNTTGQPIPPGWEVFDLTRPEVLQFLQNTASQLSAWGFESVKFDFSYVALFVKNTYDTYKSEIEAFRQGLRTFRSGLDPGTYFINIMMVGINIGLVDGMRIGQDLWPCWGDMEGENCPYFQLTTGPYAQGIRPGVRNLARRYYFHNRVWHTHPDQVYFRDFLSFEAQRAWATVVGLSGGIVSLGDDATTLSSEGEDVFRRLLPVLGRPARPVDLLSREYPEVWHLDLSGYCPAGHVFGMFNWGTNLDLSQSPYASIPEEERTIVADLETLGLHGKYLAYELWTEDYLGEVQGRLMVTVPPRDCRVIVLRPLEEHPQIISSNRHISQGANDLSDVSWDPTARKLNWRQKVVAGFPHRVVLSRAGYIIAQVEVTAGDASANVGIKDDTYVVEISAGATGEIVLEATFSNDSR